MAAQESVAIRNAGVDAKVALIGASALMRIFSGAQPANCAAPDPSGLLCSIPLPASWMGAAANGVAAKLGVWSAAAAGAGIAASWRLYNQAGSVCHQQGNVSDLVFDNTNIAVSQVITVGTFTMTAGNS